MWNRQASSTFKYAIKKIQAEYLNPKLANKNTNTEMISSYQYWDLDRRKNFEFEVSVIRYQDKKNLAMIHAPNR